MFEAESQQKGLLLYRLEPIDSLVEKERRVVLIRKFEEFGGNIIHDDFNLSPDCTFYIECR